MAKSSDMEIEVLSYDVSMWLSTKYLVVTVQYVTYNFYKFWEKIWIKKSVAAIFFITNWLEHRRAHAWNTPAPPLPVMLFHFMGAKKVQVKAKSQHSVSLARDSMHDYQNMSLRTWLLCELVGGEKSHQQKVLYFTNRKINK